MGQDNNASYHRSADIVLRQDIMTADIVRCQPLQDDKTQYSTNNITIDSLSGREAWK